MTAIELKPIEQKTSLDILYNFETDELNKVSNHLYEFPEHTNSLIQLKDKVFKPTKLYLTPKLHNGKHSNELIVEMVGDTHHNTNTNSHKTDKLFICFTLSSSSGNYHSSLTFPMKTSPLEEFVNMYGSTNLFYTTRNRHPVIVCPTVIRVGNDFPIITSTARKVYKDIFEPNEFHILSSIITLQDNNPRTIEAGSNLVHFQKQLFSIVEGFNTISYESISGYYLECNALADIGNEDKSEFIITPLKTKVDASLFAMIFFIFLFLGLFFVPILTILFIYNHKEDTLPNNLVHIIFICGFVLATILTIAFKAKDKKFKKKKRGHGINSSKLYKNDRKNKKNYNGALISLLCFLGLLVGDKLGLLILLNSNYQDSNKHTYKLDTMDSNKWFSYMTIYPYNFIEKIGADNRKMEKDKSTKNNSVVPAF